VPPDYPIEETARLMIEHNISGIPVVDQDMRPIGIITHSDVFAQFAKALGADTPALRLTVQVPNRLGELAELVLRIAEAGGNICSVVSHCPSDSDCMDLTMRVENIQLEELSQAIGTHLAAEIVHVWERQPEEQDE
jgi:acetoin utilization protein AcuB